MILPDGFVYDWFYWPDAHWVDLPVPNPRDVRPLDLEKKSVGAFDWNFAMELYLEWLMETELLLVFLNRMSLVPVIKEHEQAGGIDKTGECARAFEDPIPSSQYCRTSGPTRKHLGRKST